MTYIPLPKTSQGGVDIQGSLLGKGDLTVDAWGVQKMSIAHSLFHGMWTYDIPLSMWLVKESNVELIGAISTKVTSTGGMAQILAESGSEHTVLESLEAPRYQPNRGHLFSTAVVCPSKTLAGTREWGLATDDNGVFFRLKSDGLLYAVLRSGGVETKEEVIDTSVLTGFNVEKNNTYDIQFQWRSAGNYKFFIGDPDTGESKLVHTFSLLGSLTGASMENPALPVRFVSKWTSGAAISFKVGCCDVTTENGDHSDILQFKSAYAASVTVNGTDVPVIAIRNPATISGKTNTRTINIARVSMNCSKKAVFKGWGTRSSGAVTGGTFATIDAGSFMDCDSPDSAVGAVRSTAFVKAQAGFITALNVEANTRQTWENPMMDRIELPIVRGDYLIITCSASTATADVVIEWGEQV